MLSRWENTEPYSQPVQSIWLGGDRFPLPADLIKGLSFLLPFVQRKGNPVEEWVHLINGKLLVITNSLIVDYEISAEALPDLKFDAKVIRALSAFGSAPSYLINDQEDFCLEWDDGQRFFISSKGFLKPIWFGNYKPTNNDRSAAIDTYWGFDTGVALDDQTRSKLCRSLSPAKLHQDVFVSPRYVVSRMKSLPHVDGWTSEHVDDFENNSVRPMRFDRKAFVQMIKVAKEIDFTCSPVCFRHGNGRGLLIERTLGSDAPDLEWVE